MTPQDVVSIAEISQYLWNDSIPKQNAFFNGSIDPRKAQQLYLERKALQYGIDQSLSGIPGTSNYVYALCGAKLQLAIEILGNGNGGGGVIPGGGGNFSVFEYSTNAVLGTFTQGNNIGAILTSGTPTGNQVVWDKTNGSLTVAVAFYSNEFVRVVVQQ